MVKSTYEEHFPQPLQTNHNKFKMAFTFLTGYDGVFNNTNKNDKLYFRVSINADGFSKIGISPGAQEVESSN